MRDGLKLAFSRKWEIEGTDSAGQKLRKKKDSVDAGEEGRAWVCLALTLHVFDRSNLRSQDVFDVSHIEGKGKSNRRDG